MGYYVTIKESTFQIPKENLDKAYEAMCELNHTVPNKDKGGGSYPGKDKAPYSGPDKSCWFSWMAWNYHEICKDANDILEHLGFETSYDAEGNLCIEWYDSKTGQESLFLESICSLSKGYIVWQGEQDEVWGETYGGSEVIVKSRLAPDYSDLVDTQTIQEVTVELVEDAALVGISTAGLLPEGTD